MKRRLVFHQSTSNSLDLIGLLQLPSNIVHLHRLCAVSKAPTIGTLEALDWIHLPMSLPEIHRSPLHPKIYDDDKDMSSTIMQIR